MVFITEMKSVYSAVRTGSLNKAVCASSLEGYNDEIEGLIWVAYLAHKDGEKNCMPDFNADIRRKETDRQNGI